MIKFDTYNNRIMQNSIVQYTANPQSHTAQNRKPEFTSSGDNKNMAAKAMIGATALGVAVFTIAKLVKGKGDNLPAVVNNSGVNNILETLKNAEILRVNGEKPIRQGIAEYFRKSINEAPGHPDLKAVVDRIIKVTGKEKQKSFEYLDRIFSKDEAKVVASLYKDNKYNYLLRAGQIKPDEVQEIKVLNEIIEKSKPLEEDTIMYRGIRTKRIWDDFGELDFSKNIYEGAILEDKGFASATRVYGDELAQVDPHWLEEPDSGYILRIKVPKDTKGIDCRGFSGIEAENGLNSVFYLPMNSKFHISKIDDEARIIDCELLKG